MEFMDSMIEPALMVDRGGVSAVGRASDPEALITAFLGGRNGRTLKAYEADLWDFRAFLNAEDLNQTARILLSCAPGQANALVLAYRASLINRKLQAATVNRRLASIRSLVKLGRLLGFVVWSLEVENLPTQTYRDTSGPGRRGFRQLLDALELRADSKAVRDRAALRLLFDLALRRAEVVGLDLADVNLEAGTVAVTGKGRTQKELLSLPEPTRAALSSWLSVRGTEPGPLFVNYDRAGKGTGKLTGAGLYGIVRSLGEKIGVKVRPHGLRHAGITEALDLTNGNIRAVQRYSRHRDARTLTIYDDCRRDIAGDVARLVASSVGME